MSRNQYNKRNSEDIDDSSDSNSTNEHCGCDQCLDQCLACIVCPPSDFQERYESSSSDSSCPDFSELCEDKPKICCEKKDIRKKNKHCNDEKSSESSDSSESNQLSSETDSERSNKNGCGGCEKHCNNCPSCNACGGKECCDFSRDGVMSDLGNSGDSSSDSPTFDKLALDKKKKCRDLISPCKKGNNEKVCFSERHNISSSDKKNCASFIVSDNKESSSSTKKESSSSGKKESSSSNKKESGSSSSKGKKFVVTFGSKEGHPWAEYNEGNLTVNINGKNGPVLHLYRGCTYFFCVEQDIIEGEDPKHTFILTNSPAGGSNSRLILGGFAPVSKGCVCFKVDKYTPRYFFYQDAKNAFGGGLIIVHDK